ncbi:MAG: hypothetical protein OXB88_10195, partial [Bacteriovoracales bacterium]|nr:hypothetical protein [Bacteriovoracales bacterium]
KYLTQFHRLRGEDALKEVKGLNILHIYGKTSFIEKETSGLDLDRVRSSMRNLKVVGEDRISDDQTRIKVREKILASERIYILGFGFDEQNMDILFGDKTWRGEIDGGHSDSFEPNQLDRLNIKILSTKTALSEPRIRGVIEQYSNLKIEFEDLSIKKLLEENINFPNAMPLIP